MKPVQRNIFVALIAIVLIGRFLPHPPNFTPLVAVALFCAALMRKSVWAIGIPVAALWLSDLVINNVIYASYYDHFVLASNSFVWTVLALAMIVVLAKLLLKKISTGNVVISALLGSTVFFLVSNFGSWISGMNGYPITFGGLTACYTAGIPFFLNGIGGDLVFSAVLFGGYAWANKSFLATA